MITAKRPDVPKLLLCNRIVPVQLIEIQVPRHTLRYYFSISRVGSGMFMYIF